MNYTASTWTEYFNSVLNSELAHTLFYAVVVAVVLVVGSRVLRGIMKAIDKAERRRSRTPQISRATRQQLVREGYKKTLMTERVGFKNSNRYTYTR